MNQKQFNRLKYLIENNTKAQIELSWAGSQMPEDREIIEHRAKKYYKDLSEFLHTVVRPNIKA